jgi:hypothetical protein
VVLIGFLTKCESSLKGINEITKKVSLLSRPQQSREKESYENKQKVGGARVQPWLKHEPTG